MGANSFGQLFCITTFGESHGGAVGVVIDGCPPGHQISIPGIQEFLNRRRPGQSHLTTSRAEPDRVECLSGLDGDITLGTPLTLIVRNQDTKKTDYQDIAKVYRPSHADYSWEQKFGLLASSGGGRASARETIGRVAAAAVAEQILATLAPQLRVVAFVDRVGTIAANIPDMTRVRRSDVEASLIRCPDPTTSAEMISLIEQVKAEGDSIGGTITVVVTEVPTGLGDPIFDKLEAQLAKAMLSLPACKGFEIGSGFAGTKQRGSSHNDAFVINAGKVETTTNHSGGIQGGITNGMPIYFRVAFKPVSTIFKSQDTVTKDHKPVQFKPQSGRHDPCVLPRAVPLVEAMTLLTLMDAVLRQKGIEATSNRRT